MSEKKLKPGWRKVKFGDVVQLSKARCSDPLAEGVERYVGLEHLEPGDLRIRRWGNVADGVTFTSLFKPGQVLFGKRRAYQRKVAVAEFSGVCSGDIYVLESKDAAVLLPELLPFICQTDEFCEHAVGTSAGSLSPRTNWTSLADFVFCLPPLNQQAGFVGLVRSIDSMLNLLDEENRKADQLIWSLYCSEILGRRQGGELIQDPHFGTISRNLPILTIDEIAQMVTDGEHATPHREVSGVPLLSARNIQDGYLDLSDCDYVSNETFRILSRRVKPSAGDVLLSCSGSIGRACHLATDQDLSMVRSVAIIHVQRIQYRRSLSIRPAFRPKQACRGQHRSGGGKSLRPKP
jgi:type I restriction enzyme S subunit